MQRISKCINQGFFSQPLWVLPCSCWGWTDSSFQSQVFSWEQTIFVIGHSCGSEKPEKMRLKTSLVTAQQQQRKQITPIKTAFFFIYLFNLGWIETLSSKLLTQSLVPVSVQPYLLKSSPKHFGDQFLPKQSKHLWYLGWFLLSLLPNTYIACFHTIRMKFHWPDCFPT